MQTASKEVICIGSDHTDRGGEVKNAIADFLKENGKKVIILEQGTLNDSYIAIVRHGCRMIRMRGHYSERRPEKPMPDSAIFIDQLGKATAGTANLHLGIIAVDAACPSQAYELTRKNNPNVLCIPIQYADVPNDLLVKNPKANIIKTVDKWLNTNFLQDASAEEAKRWLARQKESELIHYNHIKSLKYGI